jgi:hypothetical protein
MSQQHKKQQHLEQKLEVPESCITSGRGSFVLAPSAQADIEKIEQAQKNLFHL